MAPPKVPFITQAMKGAADVTIAASDFMKTMPDLVRSWVPGEFHFLGTDGYGRSESREALRDHFESPHPTSCWPRCTSLPPKANLNREVVAQHVKDFDINSEKLDPWVS